MIFKLKSKLRIFKDKLERRKRMLKKEKINRERLHRALEESIEREEELQNDLDRSNIKLEQVRDHLNRSLGVEELFLEENTHLMSENRNLKRMRESLEKDISDLEVQNRRLTEGQIGIDFEIFRYRTIVEQMEQQMNQ